MEFRGRINIYPEAKTFVSNFNLSKVLWENTVVHDQREGANTWTHLAVTYKGESLDFAYNMSALSHTKQSEKK